ncbi:MAG: agglutinin biogenesis protein MshP [Rhodoferax sp.]|nr:agglutinin biogenesis protein MshP [Rhodoferax sp.]MBP9685379.1 agglutinin biogenesis protein MshP [Rhodoferax sp.]
MTNCPKPPSLRGFAMVSALFLLVVLSALGAAIASISVRQHMGSALEVNLAKAHQAARAGLEWGAFATRVPLPSAPADAGVPPLCFQPQHIALRGELAGFVVSIVCVRSGPVADGARAHTFYQLQATACNAPAGGSCLVAPASPAATYVESHLSRTIAR